MSVDDRAKITTLGAPSTVTNAGIIDTNIGADVHLASVLSVASTEVRSRAALGALQTAAKATIDPSASVGATSENATLTPLRSYAWTGHFLPCSGDITVPPNGSAILAPGSYCSVTVNAGATLRVSGGSYFVQSLDVEPQAQVLANVSITKFFVRTQLLWKGALHAISGAGTSILMSYAGTLPVTLEGPLAGTLVAPNASVRLADQRDVNTGAVFAQSIEISPDVQLTQKVFSFTGAGLDGFVDPATLIAARAAVATALGDPKLFDLFNAVELSFSTGLSPYQNQLLQLMLFINANASLLNDPSQLTAGERAKLPAFTSALSSSPVLGAMSAAGQHLLNDPASLSAAISGAAAAVAAPPPQIAPAAAESCGGATPPLRLTLNSLSSSSAFAKLRAAAASAAQSSSLGRSLTPLTAAALLPAAALANLSLPNSGGQAIGWLDIAKGAIEIASGGLALGAIVAGVNVAAGNKEAADAVVDLGAGAAELQIVAGGIDLYEGATGSSGNTCPTNAQACKVNSDCGANDVCSKGCCALSQSAAALLDTGVVACTATSECGGRGFACGADGCCEAPQIDPPGP